MIYDPMMPILLLGQQPIKQYKKHLIGIHAILCICLVVPGFALGYPSASEESPTIELPFSDLRYRWGDSPVDDNGIPIWMDFPDIKWALVGKGLKLKSNQQGRHTIWFMIRLPDGDWKPPALFIPPVSSDMAVYQDNKLIYQYGDFKASYGDKFSNSRWHIIPLEGKKQNSQVFLRIHSSNPQHIGTDYGTILPKIRLGSQTRLARALVRPGLDGFILGFLYICASLLAILVYFGNRRQKQYIALSFAAFVFWSGMGPLAGSAISQLFIESDAIRYYASYSSFYMFPIGLFIFCEQVLGLGYKRVIRRMWQLHIPFAFIGLLLDITNVLPIPYALNYIFSLLITEFCIIIPISIKAAYNGNFEAKIFNIGMAAMMLSGINDMLVVIGVISMWHIMISSWGTLIFIISLAYILQRRFAEAHRQLEKYSHTLEQKVKERTQELKAAQSQIVMQAKMASLGDLVAGIAHEMNNPIGVIHSTADTANRGIRKIRDLLKTDKNLDKYSQSSKQLQRNLGFLETNHRTISAASDRIAGIVESLRAFATLDEALFQKVYIHKNIDTTLTLMQHELKNKVAVIRKYGEIPQIQCYANELNQVFMNLLSNAIQAIDQQGTITISTYANDTRVFIKIADTGRGIPPEYLSRIYDPGFTTQSDGIGKGLGLSIVYNIIQKHHGKIEVNSKLGQGTEVTIVLPIKQSGDAKE